MILSDSEIRKLCLPTEPAFNTPLIEPFSEPVSGNGIISYGITSAGYDVRLCGKKILVFKNSYGEDVDPKRFGEDIYRSRMFEVRTNLKQGERVVIPPNGYILAQTHEYITMPRHLVGRCVGKSTNARSGVLINTTPMEPEWAGHLTLEIANMTPSNCVVYVMEGIAQFQFELIHGEVGVSYKDKAGKYQNQVGVTPSKVL